MSKSERKFGRADHFLTAFLLTLLFGVTLLLFYGDIWAGSDAGMVALLVIPAALGGLTIQFADPTGSKSALGCIAFVTLGLGIIFLSTYLAEIEGLICIAMIFPFWLPAAIVGALVNRWNARTSKNQANNRLMSVGWAAIPVALLAAEQMVPPEWSNWDVTRQIEIEADAERVWPLLIDIPEIATHEGKFNLTQDILMVPRPSDARIERDQLRLVRKARWGENIRFEEVISDYQSGKSLGWNFRFPDDSVQNHTDKHISPDGDKLKIISGHYTLRPLGAGRVQLVLITRYRMRSHMDFYLSQWGEILLGDIQDNILHVVKARAEKEI